MRWFSSRRQKGLQVLDDEEDFLLVTWDSCRYDAYLEAPTPRLDSFGEARRAWVMGTYTLPSHLAMFYGFLPHVFAPEPLYNRHRQQLWRISHRNVHTTPLVTFPLGTRNIVSGFRKRGYFTVGVAARLIFKMNFTALSGLLAGSMTDPPALAFANAISKSDAPSVAYATVYPLTMLLRIITVQVLVLVFCR